MPRSKDYIPTSDADFNNWFKALSQYVSQKTTGSPPAWPHIMPDDKAELIEAYSSWYTAFGKTLTPHTPADTTEKINARRAAEHSVRNFVQRYLYWPPVTDGERRDMQLPLRDHSRTEHTEVLEEVENSVKPDGIRTLSLHFKILGVESNAKPEGYDGAVTIWHVGEEQPLTPTEYEHHQMASRTPFRIHFAEEERGKKVWIQQCWQNSRGNTGRWSEALFAYIP